MTPEDSYALGDLGIQMSWYAYPSPWKQFTNVIDMTYKSIRGILSKESTLKARHLSGPIGIFRGLAITYHHGGLLKALALLVLITYSLALLNIMPFPVLDGGHIVLAVIEEFRGGKSLPARFIQPITWPVWGSILAIRFVSQTLAKISPRMYSNSLSLNTGSFK